MRAAARSRPGLHAPQPAPALPRARCNVPLPDLAPAQARTARPSSRLRTPRARASCWPTLRSTSWGRSRTSVRRATPSAPSSWGPPRARCTARCGAGAGMGGAQGAGQGRGLNGLACRQGLAHGVPCCSMHAGIAWAWCGLGPGWDLRVQAGRFRHTLCCRCGLSASLVRACC